MGWESWLTLGATAVTCIGTIVTIVHARSAKSYKEQIKFDILRLNLSSVNDQLKKAQEDIRGLPTSSQSVPRGVKPKELIGRIRKRFDVALGIIPTKGDDRSIRRLVVSAQEALNLYEASVDGKEIQPEPVYDLQSRVQDAISEANSRIYQLEGKA